MKKSIFSLALPLLIFATISAPAMARTFYPGQDVVFTQSDGAHYNANILEIYQDRTVRIHFPSSEYSDSDVGVDTLSIALSSYREFRVNDDVVFTQTDGSHYNARIVEIFEDGHIRVSFPNNEYSTSDVDANSLSKAIFSNGYFQVNDDVIFTQTDGSHYNAKIEQMFQDGKVRVSFPNGEYSTSDVSVNSLSKALYSSGRFHVNDDVIFTQTDGRHFNAKIVQIFADGKIRVSFPNGEYSTSDVDLSSLSKVIYSSGRFQVGDDVIFTQTDGRHFNAKIEQIFEDGQVRVSFPNGEYSTSDVSSNSLSFLRNRIKS